ncbi:unnamed protein product [Caenorhabditis sp. 36 PRJEB53466]|nr:unnamed protein product [Caenorhabditis sp. 36 PRJEB53466]
MTAKSVNLTGREHLPPALRQITDSNYKFSTHKHVIESSEDGIMHTYTVHLSSKPLDGITLEALIEKAQTERKSISSDIPIKTPKKSAVTPLRGSTPSHLVSQISSTTTSEKRAAFSEKSPIVNKRSTEPSSISTGKTEIPSHYMTLPTITSSVTSSIDTQPKRYGEILKAKVRPKDESVLSRSSLLCSLNEPSSDSTSFLNSTSKSSSSTNSSDAMKLTLPKYTYSSNSVKSNRSAKFLMMVHVKFLLLHRDVFHRRVQSTFTDEFSSDCPLEDVIYNFHQLCTRHLRDHDFNPRLSYCVGDLNHANSKPVLVEDMHKTLAQLANSNSVLKFALIVDNI